MRNYNDRNDRPENSADRIRRRIEKIDKERQSVRPRISPFSLISILIILVLALIMSNAGN